MKSINLNQQPVYHELADHQRHECWTYQSLAACLLKWAEIFNVEFKLEVNNIALCIAPLSRRCYGHFRVGHNAFGLKNEVAINSLYLESREFWCVLGTLLHELLHVWQQQYGKPGSGNYHNVQFRRKASECGLIIDKQGYTEYADASPFRDILQRYGIEMPLVPTLPKRVPGYSTLKKWSCGCTNVRVGASELQAQCLRCGRPFVRCNSHASV